MHTIKITPNILFEYQCAIGKFIRLPNRIESKLFCPNWNALVPRRHGKNRSCWVAFAHKALAVSMYRCRTSRTKIAACVFLSLWASVEESTTIQATSCADCSRPRRWRHSSTVHMTDKCPITQDTWPIKTS